ERRRAGPVAGGRAVPESGPVSDELAELSGEERRAPWASWPLALALLVTTAATAWAWRAHLGDLRPGGPGLAGAELGPAATGPAPPRAPAPARGRRGRPGPGPPPGPGAPPRGAPAPAPSGGPAPARA